MKKNRSTLVDSVISKISDKNPFAKKPKFWKSNRVWITALAGVAAGLAITALLRTQRGQHILSSVEGTVKDLSGKAVNGLRKIQAA